MDSTLFPIDFISATVRNSVRAPFVMRPICPSDYDKGVLNVLGNLTTVGNITRDQFYSRFSYFKKHSHEYFIIVIENVPVGKIVACGTMLLERKFIHNCGMVGHLEDVVTLPEVRGMLFGKAIIDGLTSISSHLGAYKTILDCNAKNVTFYAAKCNYVLKEYQMVIYHNKDDDAKSG